MLAIQTNACCCSHCDCVSLSTLTAGDGILKETCITFLFTVEPYQTTSLGNCISYEAAKACSRLVFIPDDVCTYAFARESVEKMSKKVISYIKDGLDKFGHM
uniref:AlNc14C348G10880 protein n=1 Tax=Albugo laibachii Nc14 TaxID=890382 RepID=F0WXC8_9STRA|nr:AlNc14C348G10880 [Albugo laibachii Nc14]|eukprot:CCA26120.1 AlNc14C348G10880 [Albugo laibachii Nc14]